MIPGIYTGVLCNKRLMRLKIFCSWSVQATCVCVCVKASSKSVIEGNNNLVSSGEENGYCGCLITITVKFCIITDRINLDGRQTSIPVLDNE